MKKSGGVVAKEIVFSGQQDKISDRVSGLVLKESLAVVDIEVIEEETLVYNFEVEDDHTYFVTDAEVWVHNADRYDIFTKGYNQRTIIMAMALQHGISPEEAAKRIKFIDEDSIEMDGVKWTGKESQIAYNKFRNGEVTEAEIRQAAMKNNSDLDEMELKNISNSLYSQLREEENYKKFTMANLAFKDLIEGKITKTEYDIRMQEINPANAITTFDSTSSIFSDLGNGILNIGSAIGSGLVNLGSAIGNGIVSMGSTIGSGISYVAQGISNFIFPNTHTTTPQSPEPVKAGLALPGGVTPIKENPANRENPVENGGEEEKLDRTLIKVDPEKKYEKDVEIVDISGLKISQKSLTIDGQSKNRMKAMNQGACVFTCTLILISNELGMNKLVDPTTAFYEGHKRNALDTNSKGQLSNGVNDPSAIAEVFGLPEKSVTTHQIDPIKGNNEMRNILDEQLASGKPAAVRFSIPGYKKSYKHMEIVYGTAVVKMGKETKKVYLLHDVGGQKDRYLDPDTGRPFRIGNYGKIEYSKSGPRGEKVERALTDIWRIK